MAFAFGTDLPSALGAPLTADLAVGVVDFAAGFAGALIKGLAATDWALAVDLTAGLAAGLAAALVEDEEAALTACLDGVDALLTDFIASLMTGLALAECAALALDVETLAIAADLLAGLDAATGDFLGAGLVAGRTGKALGAALTGLASIADFVGAFFPLTVELPFFTVAGCLALAEFFLCVACLPEDLVMMV